MEKYFRIETSIAATNIPAMGYITGPPFWTCSKKVSSVSSIFLAFNKVGSRGKMPAPSCTSA